MPDEKFVFEKVVGLTSSEICNSCRPVGQILMLMQLQKGKKRDFVVYSYTGTIIKNERTEIFVISAKHLIEIDDEMLKAKWIVTERIFLLNMADNDLFPYIS